MSGEQTRPFDAGLVLDVFRQARNEVAEMVHAARGDDRRDVREALLHVAFRLEVLERDLGIRLGVHEGEQAPPAPREVGAVTAEPIRRMRHNTGGPAKHRAKQ